MSDIPHNEIIQREPMETEWDRIQPGHTIAVHDHGFVRYIDHMGSDRRITEAARVSYGATNKTLEEDKKLLRYLFKHKHTSPFEMCKVTFNIRMPIFVMRQYVRHRMQNLNEFSMRYKEAPDVFFIPDRWRTNAEVKNKQASTDLTMWDQETQDGWKKQVEEIYRQIYHFYQRMLRAGIAREQARIILPVGIYTEIYCCWDLHNLIHYFYLRDDPHAQGEHQDYAKAMKRIVADLFPWTMEIYEESLRDKALVKSLLEAQPRPLNERTQKEH
jgi:thymidylate synthase (FAD)